MTQRKIKRTSRKQADTKAAIRRRKRKNIWLSSVNYIFRRTRLVHPHSFWQAVFATMKANMFHVKQGG
jgi:hypothetical protein